MSSLICIPGQRLCYTDKTYISGHGTYERHGYIYSTLAGVVDIIEKNGVRVVEVHSSGSQTTIPVQGDIVTVQVTIVTQQYCKCIIKCVGSVALSRSYRGILRKEDVRATEKDRIDLYKCFHPGDIVLARILPVVEPHIYQLSTAENELGVVNAFSELGCSMVPINWTEMQCPKSLVKSARKVAKVVPETVAQETVQ